MCESPHWGEPCSIDECKLNNPSYLIQKLYELINDEVACKMVSRHLSILNSYVKVSPRGFYITDIPYVSSVLEFLSENYVESDHYKKSLLDLLELGSQLPLLRKLSEELVAINIMKEYFAVISSMIAAVQNEEIENILVSSVSCLLSHQKPPHADSLKPKYCHLALQQSCLPQIVAEMMEIASPDVFSSLLNLTLVISASPVDCCCVMVEAGAVNALLLRLDSVRDRTTIINVLWCLLWPVKRPQPSLAPPSHKSMEMLKDFLCAELEHEKGGLKNDIVSVVLLLLSTYPALPFVESGLARIVVTLSVAPEMGNNSPWYTNKALLLPTAENLQFKKLLLMCICLSLHLPGIEELLESEQVLKYILYVVNPRPSYSNVKWSPSQSQELISHVFLTLCILVTRISEGFINNEVPHSLLIFLGKYKYEAYDPKLLHMCMQAVAFMVDQQLTPLLNKFRGKTEINIIIDLCECILMKSSLTIILQRILTLIYYVLEVLTRNNRCIQDLHGPRIIYIVLLGLSRSLDPKPSDSVEDTRMLIALAGLLWENTATSSHNREIFIEKCGMHLLLDVMTNSVFSVKFIFLGVIVDMTEERNCVVQLLSWRHRKCRSLSFMKVLVDMWREEEYHLGVERTERGCVKDVSMPLVGREQRKLVFDNPMQPSTSPAISDVFCSVRPKAYAIAQHIKRFENELQGNSFGLDTDGQVTKILMDNYLPLKLGEVWLEVVQELRVIGIEPVNTDADALKTLCRNYRDWAVTIQKQQMALVDRKVRQESREENKMYDVLHECEKPIVLDVLRELDFISRTTDRLFQLARCHIQKDQVNESLRSARQEGSSSFQRTFIDTNTSVMPPLKFVVLDSLPYEDHSLASVSTESLLKF